jgi:hypothetical protein
VARLLRVRERRPLGNRLVGESEADEAAIDPPVGPQARDHLLADVAALVRGDRILQPDLLGEVRVVRVLSQARPSGLDAEDLRRLVRDRPGSRLAERPLPFGKALPRPEELGGELALGREGGVLWHKREDESAGAGSVDADHRVLLRHVADGHLLEGRIFRQVRRDGSERHGRHEQEHAVARVPHPAEVDQLSLRGQPGGGPGLTAAEAPDVLRQLSWRTRRGRLDRQTPSAAWCATAPRAAR